MMDMFIKMLLGYEGEGGRDIDGGIRQRQTTTTTTDIGG